MIAGQRLPVVTHWSDTRPSNGSRIQNISAALRILPTDGLPFVQSGIGPIGNSSSILKNGKPFASSIL
jgi:hypothetical protein